MKMMQAKTSSTLIFQHFKLRGVFLFSGFTNSMFTPGKEEEERLKST